MKGAILSDSGGVIYLLADKTLYTLAPVPIEQQVNQLLALRRVQEALNLLDRTSDGYVNVIQFSPSFHRFCFIRPFSVSLSVYVCVCLALSLSLFDL